MALWELGYRYARPNRVSRLGINNDMSSGRAGSRSHWGNSMSSTILRSPSSLRIPSIRFSNIGSSHQRHVSAMASTFPPSSIRPILKEVTSLLTSRNENISVAETVSLPVHPSKFAQSYDLAHPQHNTRPLEASSLPPSSPFLARANSTAAV